MGPHPGTGESLGAIYNVRDGADRVTGWDLTFSSPKTVSALWATAGGEVGMVVREAHAAAVAAGLGYLEDHAAFARQGKAGVRQVDTDGYMAAAFVHRSSRAGTRSCTAMSWFPDGSGVLMGCGGRWIRGRCIVSSSRPGWCTRRP